MVLHHLFKPLMEKCNETISRMQFLKLGKIGDKVVEVCIKLVFWEFIQEDVGQKKTYALEELTRVGSMRAKGARPEEIWGKKQKPRKVM